MKSLSPLICLFLILYNGCFIVKATELENATAGNSNGLTTNVNQNGNFQNSPTQVITGQQNTNNCGVGIYAQLGSNFQTSSFQAGVNINPNKCEKQSLIENIRQTGETNRECIRARTQLAIAGKNPDIPCDKVKITN
jgi:hypothetical protein